MYDAISLSTRRKNKKKNPCKPVFFLGYGNRPERTTAATAVAAAGRTAGDGVTFAGQRRGREPKTVGDQRREQQRDSGERPEPAESDGGRQKSRLPGMRQDVRDKSVSEGNAGARFYGT